MNKPVEFSLDDLRGAPDLEALKARIESKNLTPGWIPRKEPPLWHEPRSEYSTMHWKWSDAKAGMDGAARLIGTDLAERRNLIMSNPTGDNEISSTRTLISAYQTILPGEIARTHRHAPHAFRVILDSKGAWSCVDGDKHPMETGDIVLTPGGSWHGHGHDGTEQSYWFDGLDVPLVHLLEPMSAEDHPLVYEPIKRVTPDSPYRFTWEWQQGQLDAAKDDPEGFFGRRIAIDTSTMPTIGINVHRWKAGFQSRPQRSTAHQIFLVMQGSGTTLVDGEPIDWGFGDTFAIPIWKRIEHRAKDDAVVMGMTDEPLMRFCKYWKFEALN